MSDAAERHTRLNEEQRTEAIKRAEEQDRAGIGEPGVESASGRDRAGDELPRNAGTNQNDADLSGFVPPEGSVSGTRVGPGGDPTGA